MVDEPEQEKPLFRRTMVTVMLLPPEVVVPPEVVDTTVWACSTLPPLTDASGCQDEMPKKLFLLKVPVTAHPLVA